MEATDLRVTKQRQLILDTVYQALVKQGECSFDVKNDMCAYRVTKPDGTVLKCAAGHLMDDTKYKVEFEGDVITNLAPNATELHAIFGEYIPADMDYHDRMKLQSFIRTTQIIHDNLNDFKGDQFEARLTTRFQKLAQDHNLEWKY